MLWQLYFLYRIIFLKYFFLRNIPYNFWSYPSIIIYFSSGVKPRSTAALLTPELQLNFENLAWTDFQNFPLLFRMRMFSFSENLNKTASSSQPWSSIHFFAEPDSAKKYSFSSLRARITTASRFTWMLYFQIISASPTCWNYFPFYRFFTLPELQPVY